MTMAMHLAKAVVSRELHCARPHRQVHVVIHSLDGSPASTSLDVHVCIPCARARVTAKLDKSSACRRYDDAEHKTNNIEVHIALCHGKDYVCAHRINHTPLRMDRSGVAPVVQVYRRLVCIHEYQ